MSINGVVQATYKYNALGQQVIRDLTQAGQIIHSVFDIDGNRIAEYLYDDVAQTSCLLREYVWLDGVAVAVIENETVYYVRTDHIGRPSFATDDTGTIVWEANYLPFGGVQTTTGSPIELRFPGQWFQSESGLHQNWMRDYDPTTGRYLQADPLGLVDGASVYGYALQNPGRYSDPRGESIFDIFKPKKPANDNFPPKECAPKPRKCNLIRALDEAGQRALGIGGKYPNGKLCIYKCPDDYAKMEFHSRWATCNSPVLELETNPLSPSDLGKLGLY